MGACGPRLEDYDLNDPIERDCWLAAMAERGATTEQLANKLRMPEFAVLMRLMWLKEEGFIGQPNGERLRPCLTCREDFMSAGPQNRMCDVCRTGDVAEWYEECV